MEKNYRNFMKTIGTAGLFTSLLAGSIGLYEMKTAKSEDEYKKASYETMQILGASLFPSIACLYEGFKKERFR